MNSRSVNRCRIIFLLCVAVIFNRQVSAQCQGGNYSGRLMPGVAWQQITVNGGTYYEFDAVANYVYSFSFCNNHGGGYSFFDAQISILNNFGYNEEDGFNDNFCGTQGLQPYLTWACHRSGTYRVLLTKQGCISQQGLGVLAYRGLPADECPSGLGTGVTNVNALPYQSGSGTLNGSVNDLDGNIPALQGDKTYYKGEDKLWIIDPATAGNITVQLNTGSPSVSLSVFKGCPLTGNTSVCVGLSQGDGNRSLSFCGEAHTLYYVLADSRISSNGFNYTDFLISSPVSQFICGAGKIIPVGSLPFTSTGRTTCGKLNDLTATNTISCGSSRYLSGEDEIFSFTPTVTGDITISLNSQSAYTAMFLFNSCPMSGYCAGNTGSCIASACSPSGSKDLCAAVSAGQTYYLVCDSWQGCMNYSISLSAPRHNAIGTTCYNPVEIIKLPFIANNETTACFGDDYNNYGAGSCGSLYESGEDKVYAYHAQGAECISLLLTNASSTAIGYHVYNGIPGKAGSHCLGSGGGATAGTINTDIVLPSAGIYYIIIDSWNEPYNVNYNLTLLSHGSGVLNDDPCDATLIHDGRVISGDNSCSGHVNEPLSPACWGNNNSMNTVWYKFKPQSPHAIKISVIPVTLPDPLLAVYTGSCKSQLSLLACNSGGNACGSLSYSSVKGSQVLLPAVDTSMEYYIAVDGGQSHTGTFNLLVQADNIPTDLYYGQDYSHPLHVCSKFLNIADPGFNGFGDVCELTGGGSSCLNDGEKNSAWIEFRTKDIGLLEFSIVPTDWDGNAGICNSDYDFALYRITGSGAVSPAQISAGVQPLRCSFSALGITGLYGNTNGVSPADYPGFGAAFRNGVAVTAGEKYLLLVSNYSGSQKGFTLKFGRAVPLDLSQHNPLVWTGTLNTDWNQPANWGGCQVPDSSTDVIIPAFPVNQPVSAGNAAVKNLEVLPGAVLTLNDYSALLCTGNINIRGSMKAGHSSIMLCGDLDQSLDGNFSGSNYPDTLLIKKHSGSVFLKTDLSLSGSLLISNGNILQTNDHEIKIAGNLLNSGSMNCNTCRLTFNGVNQQVYANADSICNVTMQNRGGGLQLLTDMNFNSHSSLDLFKGNILTGDARIYFSNTAGDALSYGNSRSFIAGNLSRAVESSVSPCSYDFPVGNTGKGFQRISLSFGNGLPQAGTISLRFDSFSGTAPVGGNDSLCGRRYSGRALDNGYWTMHASGIDSSVASVTLYNTGFTQAERAFTVMLRTTNGNWFIPPVLNGGCTSPLVTAVLRNGIALNFQDTLPLYFATAQGNNAVPVNLLSLEAKAADDHIMIEWNTSAEEKTRGYVVQRATRSGDWIPVGWVEGSGSSAVLQSYMLNDKRVAVNVVYYYRLRHIDESGDEYFSRVVAACIRQSPAVHAEAFPNPFHASTQISFLLVQKSIVTIRLVDSGGKVIEDQLKGALEAGQYVFPVNMSDKPAGVYTVLIICNEQSSQLRISKID